jgi:hypothetical protein
VYEVMKLQVLSNVAEVSGGYTLDLSSDTHFQIVSYLVDRIHEPKYGGEVVPKVRDFSK